MNLATTPEWDALRGNIINHLKRKTVMDDAEGRAGDDPEENLGKGARNLIRFKPFVMRRKRGKNNFSGNEQLKMMMNQGAKRVGRTTIDGGDGAGTEQSPVAQGLNKAIRARFRQRPGELQDVRKVKSDSNATQRGLLARSKKNFSSKSRKAQRRRLDVTF